MNADTRIKKFQLVTYMFAPNRIWKVIEINPTGTTAKVISKYGEIQFFDITVLRAV